MTNPIADGTAPLLLVSRSLTQQGNERGTSRLPTAFLSKVNQGEEYSLQIEDILHLHILGTMSRRVLFRRHRLSTFS